MYGYLRLNCQFMDVVERVEKPCKLEDLLEVFNDQGFSDYLVVYLR